MQNQINFSASHGVSELAAEINCYMSDHFQDHLKALGLPPSGKFSIFVPETIDCIELRQAGNDDICIDLPVPLAYRVLVTPTIYQWANGVSLIPTLQAFFKHGILEALKKSGLFLQDIAPRQNWGIVWGAFHLLGLQGWIRIEGQDENSQFFLTDLGAAVVAVVSENATVFENICNAIPHLRHYHQYIYDQNVAPVALDEFRSLSDLCLSHWQIVSHTSDSIRSRAEKQLTHLLDGLLIAPVLVALGMPLYRRTTDGRITAEKPGFLSQFQSHSSKSYAAASEGYQAEMLSIAVDLLCAKGLFYKNSDALVLTEWGKASLPMASPYSALAVSYLKSYQHIAELLFTNPDPLGIEQDNHVDRVMNIYGSSGAGSGPNAKEIREKILKHLFNDLPLAEQPKGIADMGCGDGSSLRRLAEFIIANTERGQHLKEYPLYVVGADLYEKPLKLTRENLSDLAQIKGVHIIVIQADISNPDAYNDKLKALQITVHDKGQDRLLALNDLLHTFMFLIHNRRLQLQSTAEAIEVIESQIANTDSHYLAQVLSQYFDLDDELIQRHSSAEVRSLFKTAYTGPSDFAPGFLVAADLIKFLLRWKPHTNKHGFVALDAHTPWNKKMLEPVPEDIKTWMRAEKLPHPLNWGMHFISRQYLMPFCEYMLALTLAGYKPMNNAIYGRIHPEHIPNVDLLDDYRFFSIGCFQSE
jgi:SAM-dependent methyltransferase